MPLTFQEIYKDYVQLVYNLSLHYLHNVQEAEEATQDVFVKVYEKLSGFKAESEIKTWIYRITINHCLDELKAKKRKKRLGYFFSLVELENSQQYLTDFNHPGVQLEDREALKQIMDEINKLPDKQKTALILKSIEGLAIKEIAQIMKTSDKAVESILMRAKLKLKNILEKNEGY